MISFNAIPKAALAQPALFELGALSPPVHCMLFAAVTAIRPMKLVRTL